MGTGWKIACATLAILLIGVSGAFFLWNGKVNSANIKITNLNGQISSLSGKNTSLQANLDDETTAKTKALADLSAMTVQQQQTQTTLTQTQGQLTAAQGQLADSKTQLTSAQSQLTAVNAQLTGTQSQLAAANTQITGLQGQVTSAQAQLAVAQSQLSTLQSKYPLKDFASFSNLSAWVNAHLMAGTTDAITSLNECLSVQKQAMQDGYYVSVIFEPLTSTTYDVYLEAIASGTLYAWGVDDATLYDFWDGVTR